MELTVLTVFHLVSALMLLKETKNTVARGVKSKSSYNLTHHFLQKRFVAIYYVIDNIAVGDCFDLKAFLILPLCRLP